MKTTVIQLIEGVTSYQGPQITKLIGPSGAWATPGVGMTARKVNVAALTVRVDETVTQTCQMSATRLGASCPAYVTAATACLGHVLKSGLDYVVDSDCMVQPS